MEQTPLSCSRRFLLSIVIMVCTGIFISLQAFALQTKPAEGIPVQDTPRSTDASNPRPMPGSPQQANIVVSIVWDDDENRDRIRPDRVNLFLLENGYPIMKKTVTAGEGWACAFHSLPLLDANGREVRYCIAEGSLPGYAISLNQEITIPSSPLSAAANIAYTVLNRRQPSTTCVSVRTSWNDSMDYEKMRPQLTKIQLFANGMPYGDEAVLDEENGWSCRFKDLPVNSKGKRISYTVAQEDVPDHYQESLSSDEEGGFLIENRHDTQESVSDDSSDMTNISGCVRWDDADDQDGLRPWEIEIILTADGRQIARKPVSAAAGWTFSFDRLPKYTDGSEIGYTITTDPIAGYETLGGSGGLTCIHKPETLELHGEVKWIEKPGSDSLRPDAVSLTLLSDEKAMKTIKASKQDSWKFFLPDLPKFKAGKEVSYSLEAGTCAGYDVSVEGMVAAYTQTAPVIAPMPESEARQDSLPEAGTYKPDDLAAFLFLIPLFFSLLACVPLLTLHIRTKGKHSCSN